MRVVDDILLNASAEHLFARAGLFSQDEEVPDFMRLFVSQANQSLERVKELVSEGRMTRKNALAFRKLLVLICARIMLHPIIANNLYLRRFALGVTETQARFELQQFSIFAAHFNVAQAQLVVNAPTLEAYFERLQVLLNEEGIPYKQGFDGELTGCWNLKHVHFMWLVEMASSLGLGFEELGKKKYALEGTRQFVDATFKFYATEDLSAMLGAAFAIENWAGNYLWIPWISGIKKLNAQRRANGEKEVKLGYLTYHEAEERHHSQATLDELLDHFQEQWFDASRFLQSAEGILNEGVLAYYASQLKNLPDKDGNEWPEEVCTPVEFDRYAMGRSCSSLDLDGSKMPIFYGHH